MAGCLTEVNWKISYGPADDRLRDFYLPALSRSVSYDRTSGFFSSWSLAIAAAGVAHLVRAGGRMRLLVGAELSEEDVRAIEFGEEGFQAALEARLLQALEELAADPTGQARRRLEVLAWMIATGRLTIRVVLPIGPDGRPLPASLAADYFHPKEGVFTDACGHQVAFSGSVNETPQGWCANYEQFSVYFSWDATRPYLAQVVERIRRLWEGREQGWRALPIPQAVRDRLLALAPSAPPLRDPLEIEPVTTPSIPVDQRERILFAFLRDAPYLQGGEYLGVHTSGVRPWPHQVRVVKEVVHRFPERFLLADEVGLGKTVEAGLILRSLVLSGAVRRCLILVPKSVQRQWQEELYEKFALNVPVYDGHSFIDYFRTVTAPDTNPWDAFPVMIASSQLAKRAQRSAELLQATPWDLVIVDEAHHARRRDILARNRYRPNRLLALLEGENGRPGLCSRTKGLLLLTATPMQLHPVELYDLLRQLGLPPVWAASEERFLRFLEELRAVRGGEGDWELLLRLARATSDEVVDDLAPALREKLGPVAWQRVYSIFTGQQSARQIRRLSSSEQAALLELCRQASPLGRKMFRATRETLRRYQEIGLLHERIPERRPEPVWINMTPEEWDLYNRVERFVSRFYQRFENERQGLGFIMTVYRKRLTSSFAALRRSLERYRAYVLDRAGPLFGLTEEDEEEADLNDDTLEELYETTTRQGLPPSLRRLMAEAIRELDAILERVASLGEDTKFTRLVDELAQVLAPRETVAVFTQYTDTMDALRERLVGVYGRSLACYSGRGGERWDGREWVRVTKEEVKNAFRIGEIRVLLCTEAASEGLNLQTCGVLINYDMPWNPMRVEQRIGRFDRIGQVYPDVWIRHYFLLGPHGEETVEARVYKALSDRIHWFRSVIGELSPILARIPRAIEQAVVAPHEEREAVLAEALAEIRREIEAQTALPSLDEWALGTPPPEGPPPAPLNLADLERTLRASSLGFRFIPHPEIPGALVLDWAGRSYGVTFDPDIADAHPGRVRLLTYGEPLLTEILETVPAPVEAFAGPGVIRACAGEVRGWFAPSADGSLCPITSLRQLEELLNGPPLAVTSSHLWEAQRAVEAVAKKRQSYVAEIDRTIENSRRGTLEERARLLIADAAACLMAAEGCDPSTALARLAGQGYPWAGLIQLVGYPEIAEVEARSATCLPEELPARLVEWVSLAKHLLQQLASCRSRGVESLECTPAVSASAVVLRV
ncbi:MAG: DEAD/DEAH box helicase family protein [Limnochordales bacterium]|nr:DEAD/DEAH box helicase family protein [Limnochordales bacterium]